MRVYWYNGGLKFEPESKEEWKALEVMRKSLETVKFESSLITPPGIPQYQSSEDE